MRDHRHVICFDRDAGPSKRRAEAAVAARNDAQTGQAIVAFVTLKGGREGSVEELEELRNHVAQKIGPIAKPANIVFTGELPKTRSGKIMRRLLRDVAENRPLGDTTTLADPAVHVAVLVLDDAGHQRLRRIEQVADVQRRVADEVAQEIVLGEAHVLEREPDRRCDEVDRVRLLGERRIVNERGNTAAAALVDDVDRVVLAVCPCDPDEDRRPPPKAELPFAFELAIEDKGAPVELEIGALHLLDAVHEHLEWPGQVTWETDAGSPMRALGHAHTMAAGAPEADPA